VDQAEVVLLLVAGVAPVGDEDLGGLVLPRLAAPRAEGVEGQALRDFPSADQGYVVT
jgi:hypothetical protein